MPQAADRSAAASPGDEHVIGVVSGPDQDRARVSVYGQRLGRDARREPAERHVQCMPQPLPCGVRPVLEQLLANELVVRQLGAARNPGVDGNKGSLIDAGRLSAYRSAGRLRGLPLTPAMILRTPGIIRLLPPGQAR